MTKGQTRIYNPRTDNTMTKRKMTKGQTRIYNRRTDNTMTKRKMTKDKQGSIIQEQTIQ